MNLILSVIAVGTAGYFFATFPLWEYLRWHLWNKKHGDKDYLKPVKPIQCSGCVAFWIGIFYFMPLAWQEWILAAFLCALVGKIIEHYL